MSLYPCDLGWLAMNLGLGLCQWLISISLKSFVKWSTVAIKRENQGRKVTSVKVLLLYSRVRISDSQRGYLT